MLFPKFSTAPGNVDLLATSGFYAEVGFFHACIGAATNGLVDTVLGIITQILISVSEALTNLSPHPLLEAAETPMTFQLISPSFLVGVALCTCHLRLPWYPHSGSRLQCYS